MTGGLRRRLQAWWLARLPPTDQWTLTQRNVYIVPTRAGLAFAITLLLLLVGAINYQLNLGYALTFLLAGSALASMHMTHGSLRGLTLHLKPPSPCFAGDAALLEIAIDNPGAARHGLGFAVDGVGGGATDFSWVEIDARGRSLLSLSCRFARRGHHALPVLRVESRFPFGLFRAWSLWRPAARVWVYPAPERPAPELPPARQAAEAGPATSRGGTDEFDSLRPWRRGDALRQVVWKQLARSGTLISRESSHAARPQLWLAWDDTRGPDPEARLSRLAAWALAAEAQGQVWGLRLPGAEIAQAAGTAHQHEALQALARWTR